MALDADGLTVLAALSIVVASLAMVLAAYAIASNYVLDRKIQELLDERGVVRMPWIPLAEIMAACGKKDQDAGVQNSKVHEALSSQKKQLQETRTHFIASVESLSSRTGILEKHMGQIQAQLHENAETTPRGASGARGPVLSSRYGFLNAGMKDVMASTVGGISVGGLDAKDLQNEARDVPKAHISLALPASANNGMPAKSNGRTASAPLVQEAAIKQQESGGKKAPEHEKTGTQAPPPPGRRALPAEPQAGAATLIAKYEAAASSRASSVAADPLDQYHQGKEKNDNGFVLEADIGVGAIDHFQRRQLPNTLWTPTDPLKIYARANSSPSVIKPSAVGEGLEGKGSGGSGALEFWGGAVGAGGKGGQYASGALSARGRRQTNNPGALSSRGIDPEKHPELHNKELTQMKQLVEANCAGQAVVVSRTEIKCLYCNEIRACAPYRPQSFYFRDSDHDSSSDGHMWRCLKNPANTSKLGAKRLGLHIAAGKVLI